MLSFPYKVLLARFAQVIKFIFKNSSMTSTKQKSNMLKNAKIIKKEIDIHLSFKPFAIHVIKTLKFDKFGSIDIETEEMKLNLKKE